MCGRRRPPGAGAGAARHRGGRPVPAAERQRQLHAGEAERQGRDQPCRRRGLRRASAARHGAASNGLGGTHGRRAAAASPFRQHPGLRPVPGRVRRELGAGPVGPGAPRGGECRRQRRRLRRGPAADAGDQPGGAGARLRPAARHAGPAPHRARQPGHGARKRRTDRERARGGLATDLDVANARAQLERRRPACRSWSSRRTQQINAISPPARRAARRPGGRAAPPRPVPPVPPRVPVGVPSELAQRRPDIRQAEAQLHAATADIGQAEADFYPKITLSGSFALQATQFKDLGNWARRTFGWARASRSRSSRAAACAAPWSCGRRSSRRPRSTTRRRCWAPSTTWTTR